MPVELNVHTGISCECHSRVPTKNPAAAAQIIIEIGFAGHFDPLLEDLSFDRRTRARHEAAGHG